MNITYLQYFVTLAKVKNYTQAAKSLYITQPSLSQSIARLERELNTTLFKRSTVKVELTYTGELFLKAAQDILFLYGDVTERIHMVEDMTMGTLSLGIPYAYSNMVIPPVLQTFTARYPRIKTSVTEDRSSRLVELFADNRLDLVFIDSDALSALSNQKEYQCERVIADDPLVFVVPPNHSLCRGGISLPQTKYNLPELSLSDLADSRFVMLQANHRLRKKINQLFEEEDFVPDVMLEVNQLESVLYNAVYGKAVTVVPYVIFSLFKDTNKGWAFLLRGNSFRSDYYCVYSPNSPSMASAREFTRIAADMLKSV